MFYLPCSGVTGNCLHRKGIHFISKVSYRYFIFNCNSSNKGVIFNFVTEIVNIWCTNIKLLYRKVWSSLASKVFYKYSIINVSVNTTDL
jgi:hypothetical protein